MAATSLYARTPLPIAAEVHARLRGQRQPDHAAHLGAVVHPAVILAPRAFLGVAAEKDAADVVVVALLGAAHAGEEGRRAVRASTVQAVGNAVIDDFDGVAGWPARSMRPDSFTMISVSRATRLRMKGQEASPSERNPPAAPCRPARG